MSHEYTTRSTSRNTATVNDRVISESSTTRRLVRPQLIDNPHNAEAAVSITIIHQRKGPGDVWEDVPADSLSTLKAREQAKLSLSSEETLRLHEELTTLFKIYEEKGILPGKKKVVVGFDSEMLKVPPQRKQLIEALLEQEHSEEVWQELVDKQPDLATKFSLARLQQERTAALNEFRRALEEDRSEEFWQKFFESNTWIFGYGLRYQFLHTLQAQPHYGGVKYTGAGGEKGDYLSATSGDVQFTVLVEIKRPDTQLLQSKEYRSGVYPPSTELAGAMAQVQVNCRKWEETSKYEQNVEMLGKEAIYTVGPKGILVIGRTSELDSLDRRVSFQLLRQHTANPEVITFDELYHRARFIVEHGSVGSTLPVEEEPQDDSGGWPFNDDEIPF